MATQPRLTPLLVTEDRDQSIAEVNWDEDDPTHYSMLISGLFIVTGPKDNSYAGSLEECELYQCSLP